VPTAPSSANHEPWFCLRGSLGGGVASTRSEGECAKRTDFSRTAQATPSRKPPASCSFSAGGNTLNMNPSSAIRTISDPTFLRSAWREISKKNKRSRGVDNITIQAFMQNLDSNLSDIGKSLRDGTFKFNRLRAHAIERAGKKSRPIQIATVRDRVVMKALAMHVAPAFRAYDLECSYAFIKGRGVKCAMARVKELIDQGNKYYFEADIINFFGSVERETLWKMFAAKIKHRSLLPLLKQCFELELENLESYEMEFQNLFLGADSGIPQGGMLSPMLANFYLHYFDRKMLERGFNLIRYADDFVVLSSSEEQARQAYELSKMF
jgi:RNA-directed DNA polymerase